MATVMIPVQGPASATSAEFTSAASCCSSLLMDQDDNVMLHVISFCDHVAFSKLIFVSRRLGDLVDSIMRPEIDGFFRGADIDCGRFKGRRGELGLFFIHYRTRGGGAQLDLIALMMSDYEDVTGKRKEDFTEMDYRRIAHEAAKEAIGVNLAERKSLVMLIHWHIYYYCDIDALFQKDREAEELNEVEQARKQRFVENWKGLLMENDEVNELDFVADDEDQADELAEPWSISLRCNETIDNASAIKLFFEEFGHMSTSDDSPEIRNEKLYGSHLTEIILKRATSIKVSTFRIEDDTQYWYASYKTGIAFMFEGDNFDPLEIFAFYDDHSETM